MFGRIAGVLLICGLVVSLPRPAQAIAIAFDPASSTHHVGDLFDIDVVVSGLDSQDQIVSAFDIQIHFDATVLRVSSVTFGLDLGDPGAFLPEAITMLDVDSSSVHASEVSLLSDDELFALQLDAVTLFQIRLEALAPGTSPLEFFAGVDDVKGRLADPPQNGIPSVLPMESANGAVTVVPEPGLLLLLVFSAIGLASVRRK